MLESMKWLVRRRSVSEQLIIRLASEAHQAIHWLIWSDSEKEIIASGDIDNAQALSLLTEKAQARKVICLVPSVDVTLKSVEIKGKFTRQMQQALPYMLEDDLASDVDKLHFSILAKKTDLVEVAICFKSKLQMWLDWLAEADIFCQRIIPEVLSLPMPNEHEWQALQLNKQWLMRESEFQAWSCDNEMLNDILQLRLMDVPQQVIKSYSPLPHTEYGQWQAEEMILPMQLLAEGCIANHFNLLTGAFKVKKDSNLQLSRWKYPAIAAIILLVLTLVNVVLQTKQADQQTLIVKKQVEQVYQQAFPDQGRLSYARIKKKLRGLLADASVTEQDSGLLVMLNDIIPAVKAMPNIQISTLKFNGKNQEISLAISSDSFQAFELFSAKIPEQYDYKQGALSNNKNRISGVVTVRAK
jgi:general secretion pathway protein L